MKYIFIVAGSLVILVGVMFVGYKAYNYIMQPKQTSQKSKQLREGKQENKNSDVLDQLTKKDSGEKSANPIGSSSKKEEPVSKNNGVSSQTKNTSGEQKENKLKTASLKKTGQNLQKKKGQNKNIQLPQQIDDGKNTDVSKLQEMVNTKFEKLLKGYEQTKSIVKHLKTEVIRNGRNIKAIKKNFGNSTNGKTGGVSAEKYSKLRVQKQKLKDKVSDLQAKVEELEGKYDWVRHLERKHRKNLNSTRDKLKSVKSQLRKRPVLADWDLVGMFSDGIVLKNKYDGRIKRVSEGETVDDIKIETVKIDKRVVQTEAGRIIKHN